MKIRIYALLRLVQMCSMAFVLHDRLARGGFDLGSYFGCRVLLKNNALYPWFVLVPEVGDEVEELTDLKEEAYMEVMRLVRKVSEFIHAEFGLRKVNVGCVGIVVSQLHLHVVGRQEGDPAWPGVVWGCSDKEAYDLAEAERIKGLFKQEFEG